MKILVKYYLPQNVFGEDYKTLPDSKIVESCFRYKKYDDKSIITALENSYAYYNMIIDPNEDISVFIHKAFNAIKNNDLTFIKEHLLCDPE